VNSEGCLLFTVLVVSCSPSGPRATPPDWQQVPVSIEIRLARGSAAPSLIPAAVYGQGKTVYLEPKPELSKRDIARVEATETRVNQGLFLSVWLTRAGAERMANVTTHHTGDSLAILINGVVVSVPMIREPLNLGTSRPAEIGLPLSPDEAAKLSRAVAKTWAVRR
jgi:preprotein translocase subunit SecD